MAISNLSSGLRSGVCTSTTRPTTPYEGQMIYETDTDMALLWTGSSWEYVSGVIPNIVEATTTNYVATSSTTYISTGLSATITKRKPNSIIWVVASPTFAIYTGGGGGTDMYLSSRIIETGSSRERDFKYVLRSYNVNNDARVETTKACMQWLDTESGTGSRTYRIDFKVNSSSWTGEFNMYTNDIARSEITLWEVIR